MNEAVMLKEQILLTVLMPVYNASAHLREAMASILQQTFTNFELLIVNDGSTDDTVKIIREYNDPRIRLLENEKNMGISETLNIGIRAASSDLIARMDADDICYPNRLQKQYEFMKENPDCAMVSCYVRVISNDGVFVRQEIHRDRFLYYTLQFECNIYHPAVMFRRQPVMQVNMYDRPYAEDYDLFWKIASVYKINQIEEVLMDYRLSNNSLHKVTKKDEYDVALMEVKRRNIQHFLPAKVKVPDEYILFYQYDFQPLLSSENFGQVLKCVQLFKRISYNIIKRVNPNNFDQRCMQAYKNKKYYMMLYIKPYLSKQKWLMLCLLLTEFRVIFKSIPAFKKRFVHVLNPQKIN
ncbi:glycosyltransferase [Danxiaibacter flavus]|uniref:Glycosyltransferase n=1 Tax=Danxiaibacter flavus TaxID=3049108 RepID=A0ABV3ZIH7_9BACT|nr:glycosyltransferase [Chitinophagaceae bacterium DXS]